MIHHLLHSLTYRTMFGAIDVNAHILSSSLIDIFVDLLGMDG